MTLFTLEQVRALCIVDKDTGCWNYQGAVGATGRFYFFTLDYGVTEKRTMQAPRAVWHIAHQEAPRAGWIVYRRCVNQRCLCPVHLGQARNGAEIGQHIALSGKRKGTFIESRRANLLLALAGSGIKPTSPEIVRACRAAGPEVSGRALAALHGIAQQTVSRIRRGDSHQGIV